MISQLNSLDIIMIDWRMNKGNIFDIHEAFKVIQTFILALRDRFCAALWCGIVFCVYEAISFACFIKDTSI